MCSRKTEACERASNCARLQKVCPPQCGGCHPAHLPFVSSSSHRAHSSNSPAGLQSSWQPTTLPLVPEPRWMPSAGFCQNNRVPVADTYHQSKQWHAGFMLGNERNSTLRRCNAAHVCMSKCIPVDTTPGASSRLAAGGRNLRGECKHVPNRWHGNSIEGVCKRNFAVVITVRTAHNPSSKHTVQGPPSPQGSIMRTPRDVM